MSVRRSLRNLLQRYVLGQRRDLGHGTERQVAHYSWGIRWDHRARYHYAAQVLAGPQVLDIACGVGYGAYILASKLRHSRVIAVDRDPQAIAFAQRAYSHHRIEYRRGDACDVTDDDIYDGICSFETLEHLDAPADFLTSLARRAKSRCRLVISTPNEKLYPYNRTYNPFHVRHYTPQALDDLLASCGWSVIQRACQQSQTRMAVTEGTDGRFLVYVAEAP
jgi:O-antigen biosynthesis protein